MSTLLKTLASALVTARLGTVMNVFVNDLVNTSRLSFKVRMLADSFATLDTKMHKHALLMTCFDMRTVSRRTKKTAGMLPHRGILLRRISG